MISRDFVSLAMAYWLLIHADFFFQLNLSMFLKSTIAKSCTDDVKMFMFDQKCFQPLRVPGLSESHFLDPFDCVVGFLAHLSRRLQVSL